MIDAASSPGYPTNMKAISYFLNGLCAIIFVDAVFTWINPSTDSIPRNVTSLVTEPLYAPIHALLGTTAAVGLDFAPLIWLVALQLLERSLRKRAAADENPFE